MASDRPAWLGKLLGLLADFPLEWTPDEEWGGEGRWSYGVSHASGVGVCWDDPSPDRGTEAAVFWSNGAQVRLTGPEAERLVGGVLMMMVNRVEALPPESTRV
jgi:hypothetical protein